MSYIVSPKTCHRFVGYLEEEAVITYTRAIEELEKGRLPKWYVCVSRSRLVNPLNHKKREKLDAPSIAKDYWRLPENATMKDVLYAVRSDETTHRFVNHSLGNLGPHDVNPFAIREPDMHVMGKTVEYVSCLLGECRMSLTSNRFSRETAAKYVNDSDKLIRDHSSPPKA